MEISDIIQYLHLDTDLAFLSVAKFQYKTSNWLFHFSIIFPSSIQDLFKNTMFNLNLKEVLLNQEGSILLILKSIVCYWKSMN